MTYNPYSFYSKFKYTFKKFVNKIEKISIPNNENFNDNSELIWNTASNILDYHWSIFYEKYGTNLQDLTDSNSGSQLLYQDYLKSAINTILSNKIDGLVKADGYDEDDTVWNISVSVPPSTLLNCLRYTPWRIVNKDFVSSFIIYQIVCAIEELHLLNIPHLKLTLDNIFIDENLMVKLSLPCLDSLSERIIDLSSSNQATIDNTSNVSNNLDDVLWNWMCGKMSNLDYLLYLNKLAGRSQSDPNNHPMIPWVTDFSQSNGGFRDLKISKFRINKGDEHLDKIYQDQQNELNIYDKSCPLGHIANSDIYKKFPNISKTRVPKQSMVLTEYDGIVNEHMLSNPHHVSDILSELSYYAYMARVTSIDILKKHYRSFYNPQEFRWDMAKMYAWTPDECIPQFFTDPAVFRSTHPDMPDIGLPEWCKDAEDFVKYHREILESEEISRELNHWIDLVFGYKLLGNEAVKAKNVHRQFTEKNLSLTNNGLTVLFRKPHPTRLCCNKSLIPYFGPSRPKSNDSDTICSQSNGNSIYLPEDYDPCGLVDYYKTYSTFIQDSCASSAVELKNAIKSPKPILSVALNEDVASLCCLIVELFNADKLRSDYLISQSDLKLRLDSCSQLFCDGPSRIPLAFRDSVEKILINMTSKSNYTPSIFELKRSETWLIFDRCIVNIFAFTKHIHSPQMDTVIALKHFFLTQSEATKFPIEAQTIIIPHLIYLLNLDLDIYFEQVLDIMILILHRFGLLVGRYLLIRDILPQIIKLYPKSKNLVISKHALLYQRNFLNLLLIRIGMNAFLNNMVGLLVHMLVIGQHMFGSMKESASPEMEYKNSEQDTESLNEEDRFIIGNIHFGDEDTTSQDAKRLLTDGIDEDTQSVDKLFAAPDSDSTSQCGMEIEEPKYQPTISNGCIPSSLPNLLDHLPLSDQDTSEPFVPLNKIKNKLLSPFKKKTSIKNPNKITSKVEVRKIMSQDCSKMSLAQLSYSSLIWLSDLIGPIQSSSKILCELLAQFSSCYLNCNFEEVPAESCEESNCSLVTGTYHSFVQADRDVTTVLECLRDFIGLYGLAIVWLQIRHFLDTLLDKSIFIREDMLPDTLASLVCSLSLLRFLAMLIPNEFLDSFLSGKVLDEYLPLIIRTIGNMSQPFPNGKRSRQVLLHKVIDLIYLLSSRLRFDQIKDNMNNIYKLLFGLFSKTFDCNSQGIVVYRDMPTDVIELIPDDKETSHFVVNYLPENNDFSIITANSNLSLEIPLRAHTPVKVFRTVSTSNREIAFEEMKGVITAELAYALYISFAKLMGQNKLDSLICNQTLIQALMTHHEHHLTDSSYSTPDKTKHHKLEETIETLTKSVMAHSGRHLKEHWKEYWVHELGFCDSEQYDIKQMCLGRFEGHSGSIKGFDILNCENAFLSYSRDKVVKLFSIADIDYDNVKNEVACRSSYPHLKPVSEAIFIEQMRMAVSIDGSVHLWDPFIGKKIFNTNLGLSVPNWNVLCSIPPSQSLIGVANPDGRVNVVDLRSGSSTYSYYLNASIVSSPTSNDPQSNMNGMIRKISATPDGKQLLVGNTDGYLNMIDLRMGKVTSSWRPHQNEISQIVFMKNWCVTSGLEPVGRISLVNLSNLNQTHTLYGHDVGFIHSLMVLRDQIVVGASQNRFGLFQGVHQYTSLNRLSPTVYKGIVSSASLLMHNRLLLLGNDAGGISLWY